MHLIEIAACSVSAEKKCCSLQMNHARGGFLHRRSAPELYNPVFSNTDKTTHITCWNAGKWEDQNAATSSALTLTETPRYNLKRALEDDVTNVKFSSWKQRHSPGIQPANHYEPPTAASPKHQKTDMNRSFVHEPKYGYHGDQADVKCENTEHQALYDRQAEAKGVEVEKGDDIADARIQLAWAHNKVKMLAAQLQAAREQCTQLQTASNSVAPPEVRFGITLST